MQQQQPPQQEVIERITLAYREIFEISPKLVQQFGKTVKELDVSNNNIKYVFLISDNKKSMKRSNTKICIYS